MTLIKQKFTNYNLENTGSKEIYSIRLNPKEVLALKQAQKLLNQPKASTALKQLATIGFQSLQREELELPLKMISNNFRKNQENTGLDLFELPKNE